MSESPGSKWMSGRAALGGLGDDLVDEADDRRVLLAREGDLLRLGDVGRGRLGRRGVGAEVALVGEIGIVEPDRVEPVGIVQALDDEGDVGGGGDRGADLVARHHRDVVDGEHVGRVRHGDEQGALVDEGDRDGLVALDGGGRHELRGGGVDTEVAKGEVIEAEALGEPPGELLLGHRARREQDALGPRVLVVGRAGGDVELLAGDEAQVDEDVAEHAARASAARRGRHAVPLASGDGGGCVG
jgi:hypothetical protein